jgi:hypothetical protein
MEKTDNFSDATTGEDSEEEDEFNNADFHTNYIYDFGGNDATPPVFKDNGRVDIADNMPFWKRQGARAKCSEGDGKFTKCEELGCYFDHVMKMCVPKFDEETQNDKVIQFLDDQHQSFEMEEKRKKFKAFMEESMTDKMKMGFTENLEDDSVSVEDQQNDSSFEDRMARRKAFLATKKRPDVHFAGDSGDLMVRNVEAAQLLRNKLGLTGKQVVRLLAFVGHAARAENGRVGVTFSNRQLDRLRQMQDLSFRRSSPAKKRQTQTTKSRASRAQGSKRATR